MNPFTDLKAIVIYALAALVAVLGLATWQYKRMFQVTDFALTTLSDAIKQQNDTANRRLVQLTNERDAKQAELDKRAAAQEKTDGKAVAQIDGDDKRQRAAPVRVRVLNCTRDAGSGGGRAPGDATAAANPGAADAGTSSGVLSKAGAGRLADAIKEIETMSAAYSSCRSRVATPQMSGEPTN